jgi:hypothetical protein
MPGIWLSVSRLGQKLAEKLNAFVACHYDHFYTDQQLTFSPINVTDLHVINQSWAPRVPDGSARRGPVQGKKMGSVYCGNVDEKER